MLINIETLLGKIKPTFTKLSAAQGLSECAEKRGILIDLREPQESADAPVKDAINIPRGILEMSMLKRFPDPELPIYLHCASGVRAVLSAEQLTRIGYKNITVLACNVTELRELSN